MRTREKLVMTLLAAALGLAPAPGTAQTASQGPEAARHGHAAAEIPSSIKVEHEEIHEELERLVRSGGRTGEAAREVARLLQEHFPKEEEYALPQLALLPALARGEATPHAAEAVRRADRLKADMPQMLREHEAIRAALARLAAAGRSERKPAAVRFTEKLRRHATSEEEVLYPSAILVGEYLKLKAGR
jgi:hypothetical protein